MGTFNKSTSISSKPQEPTKISNVEEGIHSTEDKEETVSPFKKVKLSPEVVEDPKPVEDIEPNTSTTNEDLIRRKKARRRGRR